MSKLLAITLKEIREVGSVCNYDFNLENIASAIFHWKRLYENRHDRPEEMFVFMNPEDVCNKLNPMIEDVNAHYALGSYGKFTNKKTALGIIPYKTVYLDGITLHIIVKHDIDVVMFMPYTEEETDMSKCIIFDEN